MPAAVIVTGPDASRTASPSEATQDSALDVLLLKPTAGLMQCNSVTVASLLAGEITSWISISHLTVSNICLMSQDDRLEHKLTSRREKVTVSSCGHKILSQDYQTLTFDPVNRCRFRTTGAALRGSEQGCADERATEVQCERAD